MSHLNGREDVLSLFRDRLTGLKMAKVSFMIGRGVTSRPQGGWMTD